MKKEYLQLVRKLKKQIKETEDCEEKKLFLLAIDNFIETIKSDEISEEDLIEYLKNNLEKTKEKKKPVIRYEIETIFDSHSESLNLINEKEATRQFEEKKKDFETNEEVKAISFNRVTWKNNDEPITETLERIEREVKQ
jgi:ribosomal protein L23